MPSEVPDPREGTDDRRAVTGLDLLTLAKASRLELLDSALHAPQAGFRDEDFYPSIELKAAVLALRIARNHPACTRPPARWWYLGPVLIQRIRGAWPVDDPATGRRARCQRQER